MSDQDSDAYIARKINQSIKWSLRGQKLWSFANFGSSILIIIFSAIAAVLAQQVKSNGTAIPHAADIATTLSLAVTIISTIQSKLGFERKWIANRMTRSALEQLDIDEKTGTASPELVKTLKAILSKHDEAITGSSSSG
jgi:hypothetical protein